LDLPTYKSGNPWLRLRFCWLGLVGCLVCLAGPALCAGIGWGMVFWTGGIGGNCGLGSVFSWKKRQQKNLGVPCWEFSALRVILILIEAFSAKKLHKVRSQM